MFLSTICSCSIVSVTTSGGCDVFVLSMNGDEISWSDRTRRPLTPSWRSWNQSSTCEDLSVRTPSCLNMNSLPSVTSCCKWLHIARALKSSRLYYQTKDKWTCFTAGGCIRSANEASLSHQGHVYKHKDEQINVTHQHAKGLKPTHDVHVEPIHEIIHPIL